MSRVLLVQNTRAEGSGHLGRLLADDGFDTVSINAKRDPIPDADFALVVILGAPESANDDLPYLHAEQNLIRDSVDHDIPVLGICLGSQLIARALGGSVYRGPRTEIGFYSDLKTSSDSPLFSGFEDPFTVFHWHRDTFDLPEGALRLASSEYYPNQAFQYRCAVGVQFHLEVDARMVNLWLDNFQRHSAGTLDIQRIRMDVDEQIQTVHSNMNLFYDNFKSTFGL